MKNEDIHQYIATQIYPQFYRRKSEQLKELHLNKLLRRKNPYLFRAKNLSTAQDFVKALLEASVTSGEETTFGNFLENIAIFVCTSVLAGRKSAVTGIDLEFEGENTRYLASIKSGPNWGNSSQISKMKSDFTTARKTLASSGGAKGLEIIFVEGCCYGKDDNPNKGTHLKLCGQRFWSFISGGDEELYQKIIVPLGESARAPSADFEELLAQRLNLLTQEFLEQFCENGRIDWNKLLKFNAGKS